MFKFNPRQFFLSLILSGACAFALAPARVQSMEDADFDAHHSHSSKHHSSSHNQNNQSLIFNYAVSGAFPVGTTVTPFVSSSHGKVQVGSSIVTSAGQTLVQVSLPFFGSASQGKYTPGLQINLPAGSPSIVPIFTSISVQSSILGALPTYIAEAQPGTLIPNSFNQASATYTYAPTTIPPIY